MNKARIWYTSQLLSKSGEYMITWKQLKSLRNFNRKGSKAKWFKEIETEMIENEQTRRVKDEYRDTKGNNRLKVSLPGVSQDRRRREWVVMENKENSQGIEIGKVQEKTRARIKLETWKLKERGENQRTVLEKEEGDKRGLDKRGYKVLKDISNFVERKEEGWHLIVDKEFLEGNRVIEKGRGIKERREKEQEAMEIKAESWEHELIKQIVVESRLSSRLIEILEYNRNSGMKAIYFTDSSLKSKTSMGFGGLLTNEGMKESLKVFNGSIENWGSSTRPELAAILCALLATPCDKEIEIYTDSSVAILEVEKLSNAAKARD